MRRPRVKVSLTTIDWIVEIIGAVLFILMIVYPWYYYDQLPTTIPTHFDASGNPDDYSPKNELWSSVIKGIVIYIGITILNFFPHLFNYLTTITKENAAKQYRLATTLMRRIKVLMVICFFEIAYSTVQKVLFNKESSPSWFFAVYTIMLFAVIGDYFYRAFKK